MNVHSYTLFLENLLKYFSFTKECENCWSPSTSSVWTKYLLLSHGISWIPCSIILLKNIPLPLTDWRRGSSISIVSDYGLDDWAIGVRFPAGAKDFSSSLCVQTGSGVHPASRTMGIGDPFPRAKRGRGVTLTTHPYLVPRSRMSRSYISSPPKRHHGM
jgi:hypothetical protein